jgi:hypothetical protein
MAQGANTHVIAAMRNAAMELLSFGNLAASAQTTVVSLLTKMAVERICLGSRDADRRDVLTENRLA